MNEDEGGKKDTRKERKEEHDIIKNKDRKKDIWTETKQERISIGTKKKK